MFIHWIKLNNQTKLIRVVTPLNRTNILFKLTKDYPKALIKLIGSHKMTCNELSCYVKGIQNRPFKNSF